MTPIKHQSNNTLVTPPKSWDDRGGQLRLPALHATQGKVSGITVMITYWEPSPDDVAMLLAGGKLQLTCLGGQPACNVSVLPPNESERSGIVLPN